MRKDIVFSRATVLLLQKMVYFFHGPMPSQQLAMSRKSPEPAQPLTSRSFNCSYIDIFERTFDFNRFSM